MTSWTLIRRSLRFHARAHLGTLLGAAVGSAVLIGALVVGDSVRVSLREFALARLGKTQLALASNDRFFRSDLAAALQGDLDAPVAPALQIPATASAANGAARANRVQLLGVDERFWSLAAEFPAFRFPAPEEVVLNERLADHLKVKPGDTILLRVPQPSPLSREAPIAPQENHTVPLRLKVHAIARDEEFGRFGLQANQIAPFNAFVPLAWLQERLQLPGRANLLLAATGGDAVALLQAQTTLRRDWQLADAELELRQLPDSAALELRTSRVFLDRPTGQAALAAATNAQGHLTYFVNELRVGERATPYSMVTAMGAPVVPSEMRNDEIIINQWLAEDLRAKPGDALKLTYFVVGTLRKLEVRAAHFRVRAVAPMSGPAADRELMPEFPGLAKAENCREWDAGFPIDFDQMRTQDQKYWDDHRGAPKGFITLAAGQALWTNRFGNLTAVRYPPGQNSRAKIEAALRESLDPASVGLSFQPVRQQALDASSQALDFGQLFLGFSFFLIVAALLLMSLLFQFGIEKRAVEIGTLLALGFPPRRVRQLLLLEGGALAVLGGLIGAAGGLGYARAMIYGLTTVWSDAIARSSLQFHVRPVTLLIGLCASSVVSAFTIWLALRRHARQPARQLLEEGGGEESKVQNARSKVPKFKVWKAGGIPPPALLALAGAAGMIGWALWNQETAAAGLFFGAGGLLLIAGLSWSAAWLASLASSDAAARWSLTGLGVRNVTRRRQRSLATLGLLAGGSFLVVAVGANRLDSNQGAEKRSSGTGGFALIGESAGAVYYDLNSKAGQEFYNLEATLMTGVSVVPMRVREGDDASCLNLNRAQTPRLLGVRPELLNERSAFTFAKMAKGLPVEKPWLRLHRARGDEAVPAIGDLASIQWAMGKKVGDTLLYLDERGRPFKVRLVGAVANSILQGSLLISEDEFIAHFPSASGYRTFLLDAPSNRGAEISAALSRALQDVGLELTATTGRLAEFNAVQNTYLSTFQVLGGLGLLLGSAGLAVVVLRNVLERRGELALLLAVGFRPRALTWLVLSEHGALLLVGLGVGMIAALVAVLPALVSPGAAIPLKSLSLTLAGVLASGGLWTWLATVMAMRGKLLEALRDE